jgi:hypothetical protein
LSATASIPSREYDLKGAVRSVLERFTGGGQKAAPDAVAPAPAGAPADAGTAKPN